MATENEVGAAKVRALEALATLLEVLTGSRERARGGRRRSPRPLVNDDRDTKDPNVDTFDHVGARDTSPAQAPRPPTLEEQIAAIEAALEKRIGVLEERDAIRGWRSINPIGKPADAIHEAGALVDGLQQCRRCFAVLSDYRGAMQLSSDPPLTGYSRGAYVETSGPGSWVTDAAPTCEAQS